MPLENAGEIAPVDVNTYEVHSTCPPDTRKIIMQKVRKLHSHANSVVEVKNSETIF